MTVSRVVGVALKNRRRDRRVLLPPIDIELDGAIFTTRDWSLGGFLIEDYQGGIMPGARRPLTLAITVDGKVIRRAAECEISRYEPTEGRLAAQFTRLGPETISAMEGLLTGRLRRERRERRERSRRSGR